MKITIVCGFLLPVPPVSGGALEKMWWRLARIYAEQGHEVTLISRRWPPWPDDETRAGVRLLRLPGANHRRRLWQNLLLDLLWGLRVLRALPPADILITNTVALPAFVTRLRPRAGRLVVNLNRYPKGQVRWYGGASRIQAASGVIAEAAKREAPNLRNRIRITPNPVDCRSLSLDKTPEPKAGPLRIGFIGRINQEKGLHTLVAAAQLLSSQSNLPPWQLVLRGPVAVPQGGSGDAYVTLLQGLAPDLWTDGRIVLAPPLFDPADLAQAYRQLAIFCYPTEAAAGEAHPVAVMEAMACGLPVVATDLPCFADQLIGEANALLVPLAQPTSLAAALARLLGDADLRNRLGARARETIWALDDRVIAAQHLSDFAELISAPQP